MQNKNTENSLPLLPRPPQPLPRLLHILHELSDGILERRPCIVYLVNNQHILPNQVGHFQTRQVEPLCARDFCAGLFDGVDAIGAGVLGGGVAGGELLVE